MTGPNCPTRDELRAFHRGDLRDDLAEAVATHLEACPACEAWLRELDACETAVVGLLRDGPTPEPGEAADLPPEGRDPGSVVVGPYKIVGPLGEGGMGAVFMAQQSGPVRRLVALKLIKPGMDSRQVLARFEAERQALALMDHPNIARVFDAGTTPAGRPYFAMELVEGTPITRYCDDHRLSIRERLELFVPVCRAVQHAHQKGIIHRDIKPSNVLVARYDGVAVPKVIDFGIAKATGQALTEKTLVTNLGAVVGTPAYMAPEQAELDQLDVDTRCDVYALGVLLYEMLTGSTPLTRRKLGHAAMLEVLRMVREDEAERPSARLGSSETLASLAATRRSEPARLTSMIRGDLDWVTLRALEKDRDRRYDSATALARDVERYLGDEAVEAAPPSARYRIGKFARRHRGPIRLAALAALMLILTAGISTWQAIRATLAEEAAVKARRLADDARKVTARERDLKEEALARALVEERKAKDELEVRNSVIEFCKDVFAVGRPLGKQGGLGIDVKLRTAIDAAVAKIGGAFEGRPLVEANLRRDIGATYYYLDDFPRSRVELKRAYELLKAQPGSDRLDVLDLARSLGLAYLGEGNSAAAAPLFDAAIEGFRTAYGPEDDRTLLAAQGMVGIHFRARRFAEAIATAEDILRIRRENQLRKAGGGSHLESEMNMIADLARSYQAVERIEDSRRILEEFIPISGAKLGPRHQSTLDLELLLARYYVHRERFDDAIPLFSDVAEGFKETMGATNNRTAVTLDELAKACQEAGRNDEAVRIGEANLATLERSQGLKSFATMVNAINLGTYYQGAGRYDDAIKLMEKTIAIHRERLPAGDVYMLSMEGFLARTAVMADRIDLARALIADIMARAGDRPAPDALMIAERLALVGGDLIDKGRAAEAQAPLKACLAIRDKHGPGSWQAASARSLLGAALAADKGAPPFEVEALLRDGLGGLQARADKIPPRGRGNIPLAIDSLVRFAEAAGRPDEVARWKAERAKYPATARPPVLR